MKVKFTMEKATKNTIRFTEVPNNESDTPKIGTIYVPKATLNALDWKEGQRIVLDLNVEDGK